MASQRVFVVFVLPVILSVTLATAVMADILEKPDRSLQMWPPSSSTHGMQTHVNSTEQNINIVGLEKSYTVDESFSIRVAVMDPSFDCGDLYITIHDAQSDDNVLVQRAFFEQCFVDDDADLPISDSFVASIDSSGSYVIKAEIYDDVDSISVQEEFTVE